MIVTGTPSGYIKGIAMNNFDIIIIGGGVIGTSILREFSAYELRILLLEKNNDVAEGITKANSGVIHSGFNVPPGSLKARFNVSGCKMIYNLAMDLNVPVKKTGKLVVAFDEEGKNRLQQLMRQGEENGSPDLEIVDTTRMKELEPLAGGKWGLWSPHTGIISPYLFTIALAESAGENGAEIRLNSPVVAISRKNKQYYVETTAGTYSSEWVINCAGLQSDEIARMIGIDDYQIYPYRGEYLITDKPDKLELRMPIYPVPSVNGPGLGVHITPTAENTILIGPSAEFVDSRTDLATTHIVMEDLKAEAYRLVPELDGIPFIHSYSGIRPKLVHPDNDSSFHDFIVEEKKAFPQFINLIGIESPGLTSAPSIAGYVRNIISSRRPLELKSDYNFRRPAIPRFASMSDEERLRRTESDSLWSEMVCRCETVTRAEVEDAMDRVMGEISLDAIKRRTRCGMGRCQGGFCTPRITSILKDRGYPPEKLTKKGEGSQLFYGVIKIPGADA